MRRLIGKTAMKRVLFLCGIATVFITTYFMVLPALTLDQKAASNQPALTLGQKVITESGFVAGTASDEKTEDTDAGTAEGSHVHTKDCYRKVQVLDQNGNLTGKTKWVLTCEGSKEEY